MLKRYRLDNKRSVSLEDYNPKDTADFKEKKMFKSSSTS